MQSNVKKRAGPKRFPHVLLARLLNPASHYIPTGPGADMLALQLLVFPDCPAIRAIIPDHTVITPWAAGAPVITIKAFP
ncbi:hypothetical protein CFIMG_003449RA [Ceratocystis fimbriata CBS 114723]|uniref:Uncharacterized protein n=1 Tax=Ceratocystis fimbriata CBS 114723 TaxID=1035309 RepID=A0A2C5XCF0_9PEZI|nr:hypothetical protein CFIMG_003449RA [Ceratocystis fimbriata CBS 114723]